MSESIVILNNSNIDLLFDYLTEKGCKHTTLSGEPYSNEIIKNRLKEDLKENGRVNYLIIFKDLNTYSAVSKWFDLSDEQSIHCLSYKYFMEHINSLYEH